MQDNLFDDRRFASSPADLGDCGIRVLLVEDDLVDSSWVRRQLLAYPSARFHLAVASRLDWALQHMDTVFFDAVLLDLTLPDSHGGETLLRTLMHSSRIPVIILSGNRDQQLSESARQRGVYAYLIKGLPSMESLPRMLHEAVMERRTAQADDAN
jgi:DNA-binding NtrC family response regulator